MPLVDLGVLSVLSNCQCYADFDAIDDYIILHLLVLIKEGNKGQE